VCGINNKTYGNKCGADCDNTKVACRGECPCEQSNQPLKVFGAIKPKGLNRVAKISQGHPCLWEENLSLIRKLHYIRTLNFSNKYIYSFLDANIF
jgi:hypothetical protein